MRSEIAIDIEASPAFVFALVRDVTRWEHLLPHYRRSRVAAQRPDGSVIADFVAHRRFVPWLGYGLLVAWRSQVWNDPSTGGLTFVHVAGVTNGMRVTWRLEPIPRGGTRVTITHAFAPRLPGLALVVDRVFTRHIAGRTLASYKAIAEALTVASDAARPADPTGAST